MTDAPGTVSPPMAGFSVYSALRHVQGKQYTGIHKVLVNRGLNMPLNELRRCLTKVTTAGLMKRTKRGYRMEIRICDNLVMSSFRELADNKELQLSDALSNKKWHTCGPGPICRMHDPNENKVGRLRRGASVLSVLGGQLVRNLSFLRLGKRKSTAPVSNEVKRQNSDNSSLKKPTEETDAQPPPKKPRELAQQKNVNHVLEDCWSGMTNFFSRLERTNLLQVPEPNKTEENCREIVKKNV